MGIQERQEALADEKIPKVVKADTVDQIVLRSARDLNAQLSILFTEASDFVGKNRQVGLSAWPHPTNKILAPRKLRELCGNGNFDILRIVPELAHFRENFVAKLL